MKYFVILLVSVLLLISILILFKGSQTQPLVPTPPPSLVSKEKAMPGGQQVDIKAFFTIITGNIIRSFQAEKYHNLSPDVYIENQDPTIVYVKKSGITWDDFFKTLPMKLTKDCLTTGDGETFCDKKDGSLKFYLNDIETPDLLDKEIKESDKTLIKFI